MKTVALGISEFEKIIQNDVFYVDKTYFIKEWWERRDEITLITRPRRFGKTLTLSMVECFFSHRFAGRKELFEGFSIWKDEEFHALQGKYPVIKLSLANIKPTTYESMLIQMRMMVAELYQWHSYLLESEKLPEDMKSTFALLKSEKAPDEKYMEAVKFLSNCLYLHFGEQVIILIDEYDTPMLEAYTAGFWEEAIVYIRKMFHAAFKDNPYLLKGLLTGITRITQESIFSDLNNLAVVTTTTEMYETCFGFTEEEVFAVLENYGLSGQEAEVKRWYDGFRFGKQSDIYNPWSILNLLREKKYKPYWMNTSGNGLVGKLVRSGQLSVKQEFEILLNGGTVVTEIDENITYAELEGNSMAVWSWLLTTGYLKIVGEADEGRYELALTNYEVRKAFYRLVSRWFDKSYNQYKDFQRMLLSGNLEGMQYYMERVTLETFSYFDVGKFSMESERTEQFYHGFTLGLIADLHYTHVVTSNRESGFGRYDVCIEPLDKTMDGILIEFKVFDAKREQSLEDTAKRALTQIKEKDYAADLRARGIENIRSYGFAFKGKEVLIMQG